MVRELGDERRLAPRARGGRGGDDAGCARSGTSSTRCSAAAATPSRSWDARVLNEDYHVWLGLVDGRAVATATASVSDGFVGVYVVATRPEARGRGYGEAVTWAATLCRPELPATLQASDMGKRVYERMGYRTVTDFTVWVRSERAPRS
jgi:GNAT superfamily N-acetyltransferase